MRHMQRIRACAYLVTTAFALACCDDSATSDTIADTAAETAAPDASADAAPDTSADTDPPDTGSPDSGTGTPDTATPDTSADTSTPDTSTDTSLDTGADSADSSADTGDTGTPDTSETAENDTADVGQRLPTGAGVGRALHRRGRDRPDRSRRRLRAQAAWRLVQQRGCGRTRGAARLQQADLWCRAIRHPLLPVVADPVRVRKDYEGLGRAKARVEARGGP